MSAYAKFDKDIISATPLLVVPGGTSIEGVVHTVLISHVAVCTEVVAIAEGTLPHYACNGVLFTPGALNSGVDNT